MGGCQFADWMRGWGARCGTGCLGVGCLEGAGPAAIKNAGQADPSYRDDVPQRHLTQDNN